jgi:hypothetical protein
MNSILDFFAARLRLPRSMESAPRDGTHILASIYTEDRNFFEWREVFWNPYVFSNKVTPWHAGADNMEHFSEDRLKSWTTLPDVRIVQKIRNGLNSPAPAGQRRGLSMDDNQRSIDLLTPLQSSGLGMAPARHDLGRTQAE